MTAGLTVGDDGVARCAWADRPADYREYHDREWGQPVRDDVALYERLVLESFQSGLAWLTILRKRLAFRLAFADFDPVTVAEFGPADVDRLLSDAGIVRHRGKIEAAITNARALCALWDAEGTGALTEHLTAAAAPRSHRTPRPKTFEEIPASTPGSAALARTLRARGFTFLGPTTLYAALQATGFVNDHVRGCRGASIRVHQG